MPLAEKTLSSVSGNTGWWWTWLAATCPAVTPWASTWIQIRPNALVRRRVTPYRPSLMVFLSACYFRLKIPPIFSSMSNINTNSDIVIYLYYYWCSFPFPAGLHRYVFAVYRQQGRLTCDDEPRVPNTSGGWRGSFMYHYHHHHQNTVITTTC